MAGQTKTETSIQNRVLNRFSIPIEVQLDVAEAKRRMAESQYELLVRRGQAWAGDQHTKVTDYA